MEILVESLVPRHDPGISVELDAWRAAIEALARAAPWRRVRDDVLFRFAGYPLLDRAVAVVTGHEGASRGLVLFATQEDHMLYWLSGLTGNEGGLDEAEMLSLCLDPADALDPAEVERCASLGLKTSDGLYARLRLHARGARLPHSDGAQRAMLAAVQGVAALASARGAALGAEPVRMLVPTVAGALEVQASAPPSPVISAPDPLLTGKHQLMLAYTEPVGEVSRPALVIKLARRDAVRLAGRLEGVDRVRFERREGDLWVWAGSGERDLRLLTMVDGDPQGWLDDAAAQGANLMVAAGGVKRSSLRPKDVLWMQRVEVIGPDGG